MNSELELEPAVTVRLLFFGAARDEAGSEDAELNLPASATVATARQSIFAAYPTLKEKFGRSLLIAVNQEYVAAESSINEGDEIAVFPPVSGGTTVVEDWADFFELTEDPIDVGAVARRVVRNECGATVTLDGYVREWTKGRRSLYLIYEGYPPMALKEMARLGRAAHEQFEITFIGIVHRLGRLEIGETSVVVSVGAPHRRAAFAACEWAIKELKRTVP
ncbi:MAG: molybdopterin converting factor subunit 1, partial [Pyrinomonadaceae bacterium]